MAKNNVTDWSATDSLNTDIGSTNIAEGCAPGGINDAIRKIMAQIAGFITNAVFGTVTVNGGLTVAAPTTILQDTQLPRLDLIRTGTATWHVGGSGTAGDNAFSVALNANAPSLKIDTAAGAVTMPGSLSSSGMIRATGQVTTGLNLAAGIDLSYDGANGLVQSVDRTGSAVYKPLLLYGSNVIMTPQGGGVYSGGNHLVQGVLSLGGSALGGISGQIQFNTSAGVANIATIGWQSGNELRIANAANGSVTTYVNGGLRLSVTGALVASPGPLQAGNTGAGAVRIVPGDASNSGTLDFLNGAGSSLGTIQQAIGGAITYVNAGGGGHVFQGGSVTVRTAGTGGLVAKTGTSTVTGQMVMTDSAGSPAATIGGQTIGQPTAHANTAGHAFAGHSVTVQTGTPGDGQVRLQGGASTLSGSLRLLNGSGGTVGAIWQNLMTGTNAYSAGGGGHAFDGPIISNSFVEGVTPGVGTAGGLRVRATNGGGQPIIQFIDNGGAVEFAHIRCTGSTMEFGVGGVLVLAIDTSGNLLVRGSITPNVVL